LARWRREAETEENMPEIRNESEYRARFTLNGPSTLSSSNALDLAHDIRKFEIELYWKRV
jgi:hypothetical protein